MKSSILTAPHGFFMRTGGISEGIFSSLNVHLDQPDDRFYENRKRIAHLFGFEGLVTMNQVHGTDVVVIDTVPSESLECDALIATQPNLLIGVKTADCVPILLQSETCVAAIHAGWKGAVQGIVEKTLNRMYSLGSKSIKGAIGPCIWVDSYEVQEDVAMQAPQWVIKRDKQLYLDLPNMVLSQLKDIECDPSPANTYEGNFFSYRRSCHKKETFCGRQASVIGIIN